jgi:hypothetical protein
MEGVGQCVGGARGKPHLEEEGDDLARDEKGGALGNEGGAVADLAVGAGLAHSVKKVGVGVVCAIARGAGCYGDCGCSGACGVEQGSSAVVVSLSGGGGEGGGGGGGGGERIRKAAGDCVLAGADAHSARRLLPTSN